jgi:hypothetical protein
MKYRYLSHDELKNLETELLQFLIVNGVDGKLWKEMNDNEPEKAVHLVGLFSDAILQRTLEKVNYGEKIHENHYFVFEFREKDIEMFGLRCHKSPKKLEVFEDFISILQTKPDSVELFHQTKAYYVNREIEIFGMMNNGLLLSDKSNFDFLQNLFQNA